MSRSRAVVISLSKEFWRILSVVLFENILVSFFACISRSAVRCCFVKRLKDLLLLWLTCRSKSHSSERSGRLPEIVKGQRCFFFDTWLRRRRIHSPNITPPLKLLGTWQISWGLKKRPRGADFHPPLSPPLAGVLENAHRSRIKPKILPYELSLPPRYDIETLCQNLDSAWNLRNLIYIRPIISCNLPWFLNRRNVAFTPNPWELSSAYCRFPQAGDNRTIIYLKTLGQLTM